MIDSCTFGSMTIDGQRIDSDLKIFPEGRVKANWWRASGHLLKPEDITDVIASGPDVIVVGTGIYGRMEISPRTRALLSEKGITLVAEPTETAARMYNSAMDRKEKVAGCFHLTC